MLLSVVCGSLATTFVFTVFARAVAILESVRVRVRFYLPILLKRFSSSRRRCFFVLSGIVASVIDGRLVMHI